MKTNFSIPVFFTALMVLSLFSCKKEKVDNRETVTDIDGNVYHTVTIGTQVWMVENLKATRYRNGDPIPNITANLEWRNLTTGSYCDYNNNPDNSTTRGRLYNWYAVTDGRNIAPVGWHVPSASEWTALTTYLGGESVAGGKLKEVGTTHWLSPNTGATNESGFKALPGGYRFTRDFTLPEASFVEAFCDLVDYGCWWSSTEYNDDYAGCQDVSSYDGNFKETNFTKSSGLSVRCVRD